MKILTNVELYAVAGSWALFILAFVPAERALGRRSSHVTEAPWAACSCSWRRWVSCAPTCVPRHGLSDLAPGRRVRRRGSRFCAHGSVDHAGLLGRAHAGQAVEPGGAARGGSRADHCGSIRDGAPPDLHRHARHAGRQRHRYKSVAGAAWRCGPVLLGTTLRVRAEERLLTAEFGDSYRDYARLVPALVPRLVLGRPASA